MMEKNYCVGIDIGGTKIASALFTRDGRLVGKARVAIDERGGDSAAAQVAGILVGLQSLAATEGGRVLAAGISVPGVVNQQTGLVWAPNIPGWKHFPFRDQLPAATRHLAAGDSALGEIPLHLESDRSAYILGETWLGAARGASDAVFLAVGTGIGAGILAGGRIVHGAEDIAGAVGWFALKPDFTPEYAAMGCFEAEASGDSVGRRAVRLLQEGRLSLVRDLVGNDLARVTAEVVAEAARRGDAVARQVIQESVTFLGMGVANIVSLLNPEVVVLGGGLFQAPDLLLEPVRGEFRRWAQPLAASSVRIELSALGEDAGLFGCGKLAWDHINGGPSCRP